MIKTIRLKNFQSHKDTQIEFDPGVTVLTGSSCSGKSAVLRGFRWLMENRPSGNSFISYWNRNKDGKPKEKTSVEIEYDSGLAERFKTDSVNGYAINGKELTTVGQDVPESIAELSSMGDMNVHRQLDPHFLLSLSSGEVAKYLNSIVHLEMIDKLLYLAERDSRAIKQAIEKEEAVIVELSHKIEVMGWVDEAEPFVNKMEESEAKIVSLNDSKNKVQILLDALEDRVLFIRKYKRIITEANAILSITMGRKDALTKSIEKKNTLASTVEMVKRYQNIIDKKAIIDEASKTVKRVQENKIVFIEKSNSLEKLTTTAEQYRKLISILTKSMIVEPAKKLLGRLEVRVPKFDKMGQEYNTIRTNVEQYKQAVVKTIPMLQKELDELKASMPDTCPTCGQPMKGVHCE